MSDESAPFDAHPELNRDMLFAPWSPAQMRAIDAWQHAGTVHPLTCMHSEHGSLAVTRDYLHCRICGYQQQWVPRMCAESFPSDHLPPLADLKKQFAPDPAPPVDERFKVRVDAPYEPDAPPPAVAQAVEGIEKLVVQQAGERVAALTIAIRMMEMHLELATPGGAGRDSIAWAVAMKRVACLKALKDEIASLLPAQPET